MPAYSPLVWVLAIVGIIVLLFLVARAAGVI